jgi:hypothetical protein
VDNVIGRYDKMCCVTMGCKGQKFMEWEDSWCESANLGKPGFSIGVLTKGRAVKPTCVLYFITFSVSLNG